MFLTFQNKINMGLINFDTPVIDPVAPGTISITPEGGGGSTAVNQNDPSTILAPNDPVVSNEGGITSQEASPTVADITTDPNPELSSKYAGKTPEELIQLLESNESTMTDLFGKASKAEELENILLQVMQNGGVSQQDQSNQQTPTSESPMFTEEEAMQIFKDPQGALQQFAERITEQAISKAEQNINQKQQLTAQHQEIRNNFYSQNPDLVGAEMIVGAIGNAVQAANPGVPHSRLIPAIAKAAREELAKLRGGQQQVPNSPATPAPNLGTNPRPPATPAPVGDVAEINDLISSRR